MPSRGTAFTQRGPQPPAGGPPSGLRRAPRSRGAVARLLAVGLTSIAVAVGGLAMLTAEAHAQGAPACFEVVDLAEVAGVAFVEPRAISDAGHIVGGYRPHEGSALLPFVYRDGRLTDLGGIVGSAGEATDVNNRGDIVGVSATGSTAFIVQRARSRAIDVGAPVTSAAVNARGQVVLTTTSGTFLWSGGTVSLVGPGTAAAVNNGGEIVGQLVGSGAVGEPPVRRGFVYSRGAETVLEGGPFTKATDINNAGLVVGSSFEYVPLTGPGYFEHAAIWRDGSLQVIGEMNTVAVSVNDAGVVVGANAWFGDAGPFIYRNGQISNLRDLIDPAAGWDLTGFEGQLNNREQIVGMAVRNGESRGVLLEPARCSS